MKNKTAVLVAMLVACCLLPAAKAQAHFLQHNGGVTSVLHIEPDDDPIAQHKEQLVFYLSSDTGTFDTRNCGCQVAIYLGESLVAQPSVQLASGSVSANIVFPQVGTYNVRLSGRNFVVQYAVRVEAASHGLSVSKTSTQIVAMSASSLLVLSIVAYRAIVEGKRYAKPRTDGSADKKSRSLPPKIPGA